LFVSPCSFQKINVKKRLEPGWNIFEESENLVFRVLISKDVEDKPFSGYKSISIYGKPVLKRRFETPK